MSCRFIAFIWCLGGVMMIEPAEEIMIIEPVEENYDY